MGEHKLANDRSLPPVAQETFQVHDNALGKSFPIRECSDEQLQRYFSEAENGYKQAVQQSIQAIKQTESLASIKTLLLYELDRRKRTLSVVTDLSSIQGLRRQ